MSTGLTAEQVDQLYREVMEEINDEKYSNRRHGRKPTYAFGCRGPLCRKAERDASRERYYAKRIAAGHDVYMVPRKGTRMIDPYLEKWQLDHDTYMDNRPLGTRKPVQSTA